MTASLRDGQLLSLQARDREWSRAAIKPREKPAVRQVGVISFLRGRLINHDTQPLTSIARSKPFAPKRK